MSRQDTTGSVQFSMPDSPSTASGWLVWQRGSRAATPSVVWGPAEFTPAESQAPT